MMHVDKIPDAGLEFLLWDHLERDRYWRSLSDIEKLFERGCCYPDEDLGRIAETMIQQAFEGKEIASSVPLYSDVFDIAKSDVLGRFVSEDHKRLAINEGFWRMLASTVDGEEGKFNEYNSPVQSGACKELGRLFSIDKFFDYFDFHEGAVRAVLLPSLKNLNFFDFHGIDSYVRWYLIQERVIEDRLGRKQALETKGQLIAPVIYQLLNESDYERSRRNRALVQNFIRGEIIETSYMQHVLGKVFELELRSGFLCRDYDPRLIEMCEGNLLDSDDKRVVVWRESSSDREIDLERVDDFIKDYIPGGVFEEYISGMLEEMEGMKRFDIDIFRRWMSDSKVRELIDLGKHGRIRNKTLDVYFNQGRRPKIDDLRSLGRVVGNGEFGSNNLGDRVRGFLTMDFLRKSDWNYANDLLLLYGIGHHHGDFRTAKQTGVFLDAVDEYCEVHGKVKLAQEGSCKDIVYPKYNNIPDIVERHGELFEAE